MEGKVALPFVGMVLAECAQVGLMIVSKLAMSKGMSNLVFVFYSNALASLVLLPLSLLFRRRELPPLTFKIFGGFFLLGLLGCLAQVFGYAGINYSSPTLGTAMLNLVPGFTFVFAISFRMEKLDWRTSTSLAKLMGTIVSISGAFIVTYWKGPSLLRTVSSLNLLNQLVSQESNWIIGGLLLALDCLMTSAWVILQALVLKKYPSELVVVFYYCFFVAIQSFIVCLFVEREPGAWSLVPDVKLIAVLYSGVFGSAFQVGICTWCLRKTGPVFISMFKPLGIVIAVVVGVVFQGDYFYLGSLVGATVIVIGFYAVMWGKAKEEKTRADSGLRSLESSSRKVPLLQGSIEEI
ncbi:WAT1-related protein [Tripterygium wilfordii]|uniref:WAT1-related protein n=1 Tax=Tripterygium wilfordii TaxID=458696 RepID=A0A7J7BY19_TRIWF|nr:WAT1-related protein At3g28050-like isoform X1 [Tripterygium wilfordii]KAF5726761.1 WAT1-related protein [Tripterygium wilfordii]